MHKQFLVHVILICFAIMAACSEDETTADAPSFIVAFDTMGGNSIFPKLVTQGATITQPENPVRNGWTFVGWYKDQEGTTAWSFSSDTVNANTTLYAKWSGGSVSGEYYVFFNTQGGSGIGTQAVTSGGYATQPKLYPDKDGYVFAGWYKESSGSTEWNFSTDTVTAQTTIYAKWVATPLTCTTNSGIVISGCNTALSGHINIPNYIGGRPVVSIGQSAFTGCDKMTSVAFPPFLHTIRDEAFAGTGLVSVTVPECVTELGTFAFADCTSLSQITLPDGLTKIGAAAFQGCTALASIAIPPKVTAIDAGAFKGCVALTNFVFPDMMTAVASWTLQDCGQLRSVSLPTNCKTIGIASHKACFNLTTISIPSAVTNIHNSAFDGCTGLKTLNVLAPTAPSVGSGVFTGVTGCALHHPVSGSGYAVDPWNNSTIFVTSLNDL